METIIKNDLPVLIIILIVAIALIGFLIWRNYRDEKPFERDNDENVKWYTSLTWYQILLTNTRELLQKGNYHLIS